MSSTQIDHGKSSSSVRDDAGSVLPGRGQQRGDSLHGDPTYIDRTPSKARRDSNMVPLVPNAIVAGRYKILRKLGRGGFSEVYLAADLELDRRVAVKRSSMLDADSQFALNEAKTAASLDHPAIVKIYDIVRDETNGLLIVMQFVNGSTLRTVLDQERLSVWRAVEIAQRIAQAASHAHSRGIVHRDIKPANILLDGRDNPMLSDFGLAWRQTLGYGSCSVSGTVRYMSPEQIRGELHRIDARSDIFSLGIVLYEMLSDRLPFDGADKKEIRAATLSEEPPPLRTVNEEVPVELDRVCERALRKSVKDRYASMSEFAETLQHLQHTCLEPLDGQPKKLARSQARISSRLYDSTSAQRTLLVPRGLQPFQVTDGEGYLELVPGPKHPTGLPESVFAWKQWIESTESDESHRLAVLYGIPGGGKTSFMQAGVIANLAPDIATISVECRPGHLAARISRAIVSQLALARGEKDLTDLLVRVRLEETQHSHHRKIVLILDQFESWAQRATVEQFQDLAAALRQCDGERVQAIIVVRDDHWGKATELTDLVEIPLIEGVNSRPLELLARDHARKILESMGRSYGTLPSPHEPLDAQQTGFLDRTIEELGGGHGGRVVPIQMAIFAQMAEMHHWDPAVLDGGGGLKGLYVHYFQDQFEAETAAAKNRHVLKVVVELLSLLLPGLDQSVRDKILSSAELEMAVKERFAKEEVGRTLALLSEDLRVVIRTTVTKSDAPVTQHEEIQGYRISHDFLVDPIREWTEQVKRSTWRGRAISRFNELSDMWSRRPDRRFFPSPTEYVDIFRAGCKAKATESQRAYLKAVGGYYRFWALACVLAVAVVGGVAAYAVKQRRIARAMNRDIAVAQFDSLINGDASQVSARLDELEDSQARWQIIQFANDWSHSKQQHIRGRCLLLLAQNDPNRLGVLFRRLADVEPELAVNVLELADENPAAIDVLREVTGEERARFDLTTRARAAISLAYLGETAPIEYFFDSRASPVENRVATNEAVRWRGDLKPWLQLLQSDSVCVRYHAAMILGSYPATELADRLPRSTLQEMLVDGSAILHAVADWLIHHARLDLADFTPVPPEDSDWTCSPSGIKMIRLRVAPLPDVYTQSGRGDSVGIHDLVMPEDTWEVWITPTKITNSTVRDFLDSAPAYVTDDAYRRVPVANPRPSLGHSIANVALLCNWLSRRDDLEPVYQLDTTTESASPVILGIRENRSGYRIPNSAEMLCAYVAGHDSRAASETARNVFARSGQLYEADNRMARRSARALVPNRFGIFLLDNSKSVLVRSGESWAACLPAGDGGFVGLRITDGQTNPLTGFLLVRNVFEK